MQTIRVSSFADIEQEFIERVFNVVWCSFATLTRDNRPRSRILHPIWEGATGWIGTLRSSPKADDLAYSPYASLAYVADIVKPVYVDCTAAWDDDPASKQHVWDLFAAAPAPMGYNPAPIFGSVDAPTFGVLRLTPWRIELATVPVERRVWRA